MYFRSIYYKRKKIINNLWILKNDFLGFRIINNFGTGNLGNS
jgi:hypothetical protein